MNNDKNKCALPFDFHTHTGFSDDCDISMDDMIKGAISKGIKTIAITDHHDPGYPDPEFPFIMDFDKYLPALRKSRQYYMNKIEILTGLEIGIMKGQFAQINKAVNSFPFDIIIGSFHCMRNSDMYRYDFSTADVPALLEDFYTYVYECLSEFKNYDIAGHLSILDRYIGKIYDYKPFEDQIDEILKLIINDGKGLEINTSNFRYGTDSWLPRESILRRYLQLGGEILTFGSDAHDPAYYQYHFNDAVEFAKHIGFKYYCKFHQRIPEFYNL